MLKTPRPQAVSGILILIINCINYLKKSVMLAVFELARCALYIILWIQSFLVQPFLQYAIPAIL